MTVTAIPLTVESKPRGLFSKLLRNRSAVIGGTIIVLFVLAALLARGVEPHPHARG